MWIGVKMRVVTWAAIAAWLLAAGCSGPNKGAPIRADRDDWSFRGAKGTQLTSDHYRLYSTCSDSALLQALPRVMESALAEFQRLIPNVMLPSDPMPGYVFASRGQWESFTREFAGPRAETYLMIRSGGYEEDGTLVVYFTRRGITLSVLVHEGLHQYLTVGGRRGIPAWLNEGLACHFESFDLDEFGTPTFLPKNNVQRLRGLREAVKDQRLIPIRKLMTMNAGDAVHGGDETTRVYYAQVWAVVQFLLQPPSDNPYDAGFRRLLADLGTERMRAAGGARRATSTDAQGQPLSPEEAVFHAYVTDEIDEFESRFVRFAEKLAFER